MKVTVGADSGNTVIDFTDASKRELFIKDRHCEGKQTVLAGPLEGNAKAWLDQELVRELLPYFIRFAETGRLSKLPEPSGAIVGHCFDIDGSSWHKDGQVCTKCGFGYPEKSEVEK